MSDPSTITDAMADTAAKVSDVASTFEGVEVYDDGSCSLKWGSTRVFLTVNVFDEDSSVVRVRAQCVTGAKPSPELFHHVATYQAEVGHLTITEEADGTATINFSHSLLGDFLNPAELRLTVAAVAYKADEIDDELAATFGGTVHDAGGNAG